MFIYSNIDTEEETDTEEGDTDAAETDTEKGDTDAAETDTE